LAFFCVRGNKMINLKKLKKRGFQEIDFYLDLFTSKVTIKKSKQKNVKEVYVSDAYGDKIRTSNMILGNQSHITLDDADYVPLKEVKKALRKFLNSSNKRKIWDKKAKKVVSVEYAEKEMIKMLKNSGEILVGGKNSKIKNQNSAKLFVKGIGQMDFLKKGVLMLGKRDLSLPCGEYINFNEIENIINEFIILEKTKKSKFSFFKKWKKKTLVVNFLLWANITLGALAVLLSNGSKLQKEKDEYYENYEISIFKEEPVLETEEEIIKRVTSEFHVGKKIVVEKGTEYYSSSDHQYANDVTKGTIGSELRPVTDYEISHFSILSGKEILKTASENGDNLYDEINNARKDYDCEYDELDIQVHISSPETGWVTLQDLVSEEELLPKQTGDTISMEKQFDKINKNVVSNNLMKQKETLINLKRNYLKESLAILQNMKKGNEKNLYRTLKK